METIKMSSRGQLVVPKSIRDSRGWEAGTEFTVEETKEGLLVTPKRRFPPTTVDQVFGILRWTGKPKTIEEMDQGIVDEAKRRHARGRY